MEEPEHKYDSLKLENQMCFPLYACSKEIVRRYKPYLDEINLTYTQYIVMLVMWEHKQLMVREIGEYLYLDSGTLTPVLKTLEKKGYLQRQRSKDDERQLIATLTESGEKLKDQALDIPQKMCMCMSLEQKDMEDLKRILNTMLNMI